MRRWEIEQVLAAGFVLLVPVFVLGVLATFFEHALYLAASFLGFGAAGLVWVRDELSAGLVRLAEFLGLGGAPPLR